MPRVEMYDSLESTCVIPCRSILKRFRLQLPDEIAISIPLVIVSGLIQVKASNGSLYAAPFLFANLTSIISTCFLKSN
jgi:hypothetical protein